MRQGCLEVHKQWLNSGNWVRREWWDKIMGSTGKRRWWKQLYTVQILCFAI